MSNVNQPESKIGDGHAAAMFRQGLAELRAALYTESNVAQPAEYGLYGTPTPSEVSQARGGEAPARDDGPSSIVDSRMIEADTGRDTDSRDSAEPERD
jgi:hypothetical protein